ncbi:hypothetical protein CB1_000966001 [Camelus ferus]|nr:hypothetical protein CB1_000966001 [Camelus ferus]
MGLGEGTGFYSPGTHQVDGRVWHPVEVVPPTGRSYPSCCGNCPEKRPEDSGCSGTDVRRFLPGIPRFALQIQCYQCEEFQLNNDCSSPEFIVNCTVNVQDMCQKEVMEQSAAEPAASADLASPQMKRLQVDPALPER